MFWSLDYKENNLKNTNNKSLFLGLIVISISFIISACGSSNTSNNKIQFGATSCFILESGEKMVQPDDVAKQYFLNNCAVHGIDYAFNRVVHGKDYIFISITPEKSVENFRSAFREDTTFHEVEVKDGQLSIGNVKKYASIIASKGEFRIYNLAFFDETVKETFIITLCSTEKDEIDKYFSSTEKIKTRLNCELQ